MTAAGPGSGNLGQRRQRDVRIIEAVTIQTDLDPYLSMDALASGWRVRRDRRTKQTTREYVTGYAGLSRRTLQALVNDPRDPLPS